jgi:NAD(P)-dependent dehydrogenase (short-subunit alcohol dehydrogenase family)
LAAYTASKCVIEGFSESLADELGMFGVRMKIAEPGLAPSTSFAANSGGNSVRRVSQNGWPLLVRTVHGLYARWRKIFERDGNTARRIFTASGTRCRRSSLSSWRWL